MDHALSELIEVIRYRAQNTRFIVGIDGLSRSGKTTLTADIERRLIAAGINNLVIHLDDHITDCATRYHTGAEEWFEYYRLQWDVDFLEENLFASLRGTEALRLPFYDEDIDGHRVKSVVLPALPAAILVEGVFLQRPEWRRFFDYVVYLNCPRDVRFAREKRETQLLVQKFERRYWKAEDHYLNTIHPRHCADLVIESS